jgi:hypothetical protein
MKRLASGIRTNIIYGAIALLPVAVLVYVLVKLFGFLKKLSAPLLPSGPLLYLWCAHQHADRRLVLQKDREEGSRYHPRI